VIVGGKGGNGLAAVTARFAIESYASFPDDCSMISPVTWPVLSTLNRRTTGSWCMVETTHCRSISISMSSQYGDSSGEEPSTCSVVGSAWVSLTIGMETGGVAATAGTIGMETGGLVAAAGTIGMETGGLAATAGTIGMETGGLVTVTGTIGMETGGLVAAAGNAGMGRAAMSRSRFTRSAPCSSMPLGLNRGPGACFDAATGVGTTSGGVSGTGSVPTDTLASNGGGGMTMLRALGIRS